MIHETAGVWFHGVAEVSFQFTCLVASVGLLMFLLRVKNPTLRHTMWLILLLRLVFPVGWNSPLGLLPSAPIPGYPTASVTKGETTPRVLVRRSASVSTAPAPEESRTDRVPFQTYLFLGWLGLVTALLCTQCARGLRRRYVIRRRHSAVPAEVVERVERLRKRMGLKRPVRLWFVDLATSGPAVQGCVRPTVLLPRSVLAWQPQELEPVLVHELVHLRRRDPITRALANFVQTMFFFHPVVWWVHSQLRLEREKSCDDEVVRWISGNKREYVRSLLRIVEERRRPTRFELGMIASHRPLAKRIRRMLLDDYSPYSRANGIVTAGLIAGSAVALAASTGQPPRDPSNREPGPVIRARMVPKSAYFVDSVDELDTAERFAFGADFEFGRPRGTIKPDLGELSKDRPELIPRLTELATLTCSAFIDRQGRVVRVLFHGEVSDKLTRPFRQALLAARFNPTRHYDRGKAFVETTITYSINPQPIQTSFIEPGEPLLGDEVAEVLGAQRASDAAPVQEGLPYYIAVIDKAQGLPTIAMDAERTVSFRVGIDELGNVESVEPFWRAMHASGKPADLPEEMVELIPYLRSFRFERFVLEDGSSARVQAVVDLRVSERSVEVATRAAGTEYEVAKRLFDAYRLEHGRNLDLRRPPHGPERMLLYRTGHPIQARAIAAGPSQMAIRVTDGEVLLDSACFGCRDLTSTLLFLGVDRHTIRLAEGLENLPIDADVVIRDGILRDGLLTDLELALGEQYDIRLKFEQVFDSTNTLVLKGSIDTARFDRDSDGQPVLHIFTDEKSQDPTESTGGGPFTDARVLTRLLSTQLGIPVVNETDGRSLTPFRVRIHRSAYQTRRYELLIANIEAQTDLELALEKRSNEVLLVKKRP